MIIYELHVLLRVFTLKQTSWLHETNEGILRATMILVGYEQKELEIVLQELNQTRPTVKVILFSRIPTF